MKTTVLTALIAFSGASASEQTLMGGDQKIEHGGFGAVSVKGTQVDGHSRYLVGGEGAWIVNHSLYLGFAGYGMSKGVETSVLDTAGNHQYLQMGYGGVLVGMTFYSDRVLHFGVQNLIGAGGYMLTEDRWGDQYDEECNCKNGYDQDGEGMHEASFFVWEPQVNAELNVTKFMRISSGIGYRLTYLASEKNGYSGNDLGGITGSIALKFGKF